MSWRAPNRRVPTQTVLHSPPSGVGFRWAPLGLCLFKYESCRNPSGDDGSSARPGVLSVRRMTGLSRTGDLLGCGVSRWPLHRCDRWSPGSAGGGDTAVTGQPPLATLTGGSC